MSVLTESELRRILRNKDLSSIKELEITKNQIITPSAISFLNEHNITLKYKDSSKTIKSGGSLIEEPPVEKLSIEKSDSINKNQYKTNFGIIIEEKPEYMTVIYDNVVVFKDDKRVIFRGKMDSLEEAVLKAQIHYAKENLLNLLNDLEEILEFIRKIKISETLKEPLPKVYFQGMDEREIREKANNASKYFEIEDEILSYTMGENVIILNDLRVITRETEISAYEAFKEKYGGIEREDIITALNRLSSLFNIMIFKYRTGKYKS